MVGALVYYAVVQPEVAIGGIVLQELGDENRNIRVTST